MLSTVVVERYRIAIGVLFILEILLLRLDVLSVGCYPKGI